VLELSRWRGEGVEPGGVPVGTSTGWPPGRLELLEDERRTGWEDRRFGHTLVTAAVPLADGGKQESRRLGKAETGDDSR